MQDANTMRHVSVKQGLYRHVISSIAHVQISTIMKIILKKASGTGFYPKQSLNVSS